MLDLPNRYPYNPANMNSQNFGSTYCSITLNKGDKTT